MASATALQSDHFPMLEAALHLPGVDYTLGEQDMDHVHEAVGTLAGQSEECEQEASYGQAPVQSNAASQDQQEHLVMRALQGEQTAFAEIVDQHHMLMLRTASMIVGDLDTAEDIVQDAFIQAWHHLPDLRRAGALRSWLMRIVVNQCISLKRRAARNAAFVRQALSDHETDLLAQAADDHKGRMERDWDLAQAIEMLPAKQRVVIILHYYYSMTLPEMAKSLRTSENTLKKRIQAALNNLRRILRVSSDTLEVTASSPSVFSAA